MNMSFLVHLFFYLFVSLFSGTGLLSRKETKLYPHHGYFFLSSTKVKKPLRQSEKLATPCHYFASQIWLRWIEKRETSSAGVSKCRHIFEIYDQLTKWQKQVVSISPLLHLLQSLQRFPWKWGHAPEQKLHPEGKNNNNKVILWKIIKLCGKEPDNQK